MNRCEMIPARGARIAGELEVHAREPSVMYLQEVSPQTVTTPVAADNA